MVTGTRPAAMRPDTAITLRIRVLIVSAPSNVNTSRSDDLVTYFNII
jgi:hypothetical protein